MLSANIEVGGYWFLSAVVITGIGLLAGRAFGPMRLSARTFLGAFWVGWAALAGFLQVWHLFFRIDRSAAIIPLAVGVTGLALSARAARSWAREWLARRDVMSWALVAVAAGLAVILANLATGRPTLYDTGLYHMSSVRWFTTYPEVQGLGNLHARFAFNSSSLLIAALLDSGPGAHRGFNLASGLALVPLLLECLLAAPKAFRPNGKEWPYHFFLFALIFPTLRLALSDDHMTSLTADLPSFAIGTLVGARLLGLLLDVDSRDRRYQVFWICLLSAAGVTVKLSSFVFGFASIALALATWMAKERADGRRAEAFPILASLGAAAFLLIGWMARSVVLSGYLVYPAVSTGIPVDWKITAESVVNVKNWILSWARRPYTPWRDVLGRWDWVGQWFRCAFDQQTFQFSGPFILAATGFAALSARAAFLGIRSQGEGKLWLAIAPAALSLAYWFLTAPQLRFAWAALWTVGAMGLALAVESLRPAPGAFKVGAVLALLLVPILMAYRIPALHLVTSGPRSGFGSVPGAAVKHYKTRSGLELVVPRAGDLCWDAPLPCTPYPHAGLQLRKPPDLGSGFLSNLEPGDPVIGHHP
jgi:hypothetical protein